MSESVIKTEPIETDVKPAKSEPLSPMKMSPVKVKEMAEDSEDDVPLVGHRDTCVELL